MKYLYRNDIINHFIEQRGFTKYLEIGVFEGGNIRQINCPYKDGVDPGVEGVVAPEVNYPMTSNQFFDEIAPTKPKYDIAFIDGLHHSEQVDLDIKNAIKYTNDYSVIILHDCNPPSINHTIIPRIQDAWTGDVYKAILKFQKENTNYQYYTVDTDWGVGVIIKDLPVSVKLTDEEYDNGILDWNYFNSNRNRLLNLIPSSEFK